MTAAPLPDVKPSTQIESYAHKNKKAYRFTVITPYYAITAGRFASRNVATRLAAKWRTLADEAASLSKAEFEKRKDALVHLSNSQAATA